MRANKRFVQAGENTRGQGREGSFKVKQHSMGFLVTRATLSSALNPVIRSPRSQAVLTVCMGCALDEVRGVKQYITG